MTPVCVAVTALNRDSLREQHVKHTEYKHVKIKTVQTVYATTYSDNNTNVFDHGTLQPIKKCLLSELHQSK